ncbi:MAG: DegV family protein [Candidatus Izemoplasmataceae bacterium]
MSKTAVIAVSTGCLDYLDVDRNNLFMVRCKILMHDKQYNDYTELDADTFYKALKEDTSLVPSSSMPSIGEIIETYEAVEAAGFSNVLVISISKGLSGTYEAGLMAKNAYKGNLNIWVIDSKNAAISEGFLSLLALKYIDQGKSFKEIIKAIEDLRIKRKQYFMVDNLRLFVKNGRLSSAQGFIAGVLKIKPILEVNDQGKIVPFDKVRTQSKAISRMAELIINDVKELKNYVITYNTSDNLEAYESLREQIESALPKHVAYAAPITPVIGCHTGHGTVGVAYFNLDE